jgi:cytochrome P450
MVPSMEGLMSEPLENLVRLTEPEFFMAYPYDVYARLRTAAPVYWSDRDRTWALSRYEDIRFVSKSPHLFASRFGLAASQARAEDDGMPATPDPVDGLPMPRAAALRYEASMMMGGEQLVGSDPPRHAFLRKIASHAFTPRAVSALEDEVARLAVELIDRIEPDVELDFIDAVAAPVPMMVIARMLGVSTDDLDDFRRWSDSFIELNEEHPDRSEAEVLEYIGSVMEFREYFAAELEERQTRPRDDLLTALTQAVDDDGERLDPQSQLAMAQIFLIAGNETTRGLLANAGKLLFDHADQRKLLADEPGRIPNAVEELLRYQPPVTHMCRTAVTDVELRGQKLRRGDYMILLYPAANRDEDVWEEPDRLDVTRVPDPSHLAFGFAEHFCLGAALARREARLVLGELLRRYPNYEILDDDPVRVRAHMTPGIKRMPTIFAS